MGPRAVLMCAGDFEPFYISVNAEDGGKIPIGDYLQRESSVLKKPGLRTGVNFREESGLRNKVNLRKAGGSEIEEDFRKEGKKDEDPCDARIFVAVDGGLERLLALGIEPDLVLGDFDSLGKKYGSYLEEVRRTSPESIVRLPCEKDDTDTLHALRVCMDRGCREFLLLGALGGRLDHTMANIQCLAWLRKNDAVGYLVGKDTIVTVLSAETILFPENLTATFSLFALDSRLRGVTLEGMKYPLSEGTVENTFPIGVSNEIRPGDRARVTVRDGLALVILQMPRGAGVPDPSLFERMRL
jgi:thiamine pyrophosphokinase